MFRKKRQRNPQKKNRRWKSLMASIKGHLEDRNMVSWIWGISCRFWKTWKKRKWGRITSRQRSCWWVDCCCQEIGPAYQIDNLSSWWRPTFSVQLPWRTRGTGWVLSKEWFRGRERFSKASRWLWKTTQRQDSGRCSSLWKTAKTRTNSLQRRKRQNKRCD